MNGILWKTTIIFSLLSFAATLIIFLYSFVPPEKERSGEEIFLTFCKSCHLHGTTGAPRFGNKKDWDTRRIKGINVLTDHAINGFHGMPPRGTCLNCSGEEIKSAIY